MKDSPIKLPSNKKFGYSFSVIILIISIYFLFSSNQEVGYTFLIFAGLLVVITLVYPNILNTFNKKWMQFGMLMGKIVSPITLGILFFGLFAPYGLVMKIFGRDELCLKLEKKISYWKLRKQSSEKIDFNMQF